MQKNNNSLFGRVTTIFDALNWCLKEYNRKYFTNPGTMKQLQTG